MALKVHTLKLDLDFRLINELSIVDRFGGSWESIVKKEGAQTLMQLRKIATVESTGSSTRIEGAKLTNAEIDVLISDLRTEKLEERDQQEVIGYYNTLDIIIESYSDIDITENNVKNLHSLMLKYSEKDRWHKGDYKRHPNTVERTNADGSKTVIFNTTPPGFETDDAMRKLFSWYENDLETPLIIKDALFVYEFLSIHPFQDGNGRLSRLIGTLLLLRHNYNWIQYVSFENEVENRKPEYYRVLMDCQMQRPSENVSVWVFFFIDCLKNIQQKLITKLELSNKEIKLSPREKAIFSFIENHPGAKSGQIAEKLDISLPSVKRILNEMLKANLIGKYGEGRATNYTTDRTQTVKKDLVHHFTQSEMIKTVTLNHKYDYIQIKKIILTPKFKWSKPNEWKDSLSVDRLQLNISISNVKGEKYSNTYLILNYINAYYYKPEFTLNNPILLPQNLLDNLPNDNDFPLEVKISLESLTGVIEFDVMFIYDLALNS